jgi:hypothetical protein
MRRFLTLVCLLCLAIPAGISISGCSRNPDANYCNGSGYGLKITDVAALTLTPQTTGISLAYGQWGQAAAPTGVTCKGATATIGTYTYGTTNNKLVDVSPSGSICAGTWNRNTGGGIADYTICSPPDPSPTTGGLPYATAYITASEQGVTSNPVEVFVHAPVTSVSLALPSSSSGQQQCYSQGTQTTLDAQACFAGANNTQQELCAPASAVASKSYACPGGVPAGVTSIPDCTAAIGTLAYTVGTPSIASIVTSTTTNQVSITAEQPGTTAITASVANSGSSAGYFSTCPPKSISVALANGKTSGSVTQGVTQNLVTTVTDTNGNPITGLTLDYQSTDAADILAAQSGTITTLFPGAASIYAICQPGTCNPSPINEVGVNGTGLSIASNPVNVTTASDYVWFAAPGQSQYIMPVQLTTGATNSTVRLPYVPNSMVMDRAGNSLYLGSPRELMIYSISSGEVSLQNTNVPGVVLAVSPNNGQVLINDQVRKVFYLYSVFFGTYTSFGGMGNAAVWTPDSKTLYITDNAALNNAAEGITGHTDTLYVYNVNTGWTTYPLPPSPLANSLPPGVQPPNVPQDPLPGNVAISGTVQTPALTIPSVGAYVRGTPTVAHTWCPSGTAGNYASMSFYPVGDTVSDTLGNPVQTDALVATTDGNHILGAALINNEVWLSDIGVTIPAEQCPVTSTTTGTPPVTTQTLDPLTISHNVNQIQLSSLNTAEITSINQVVASPQSNLAFITYTANANNTNALLPYYAPGTGGAAGTVGYLSLTTQQGGVSPSAPLAGAFTPDDQTFFVSTAGDNMIHFISVPLITNNPLKLNIDTQQISPNLPACTPVSAGGTDAGCTYSGPNPGTAIVPATAIVIKPRSTT